jgi:hypothetical protein
MGGPTSLGIDFTGCIVLYSAGRNGKSVHICTMSSSLLRFRIKGSCCLARRSSRHSLPDHGRLRDLITTGSPPEQLSRVTWTCIATLCNPVPLRHDLSGLGSGFEGRIANSISGRVKFHPMNERRSGDVRD